MLFMCNLDGLVSSFGSFSFKSLPKLSRLLLLVDGLFVYFSLKSLLKLMRS